MFDDIARMNTREVNDYARQLRRKNAHLRGEIARMERLWIFRALRWTSRVLKRMRTAQENQS